MKSRILSDGTLEIETNNPGVLKEPVQFLIDRELRRKLVVIADRTTARSQSAAIRNAIRIAYESLEAK